jgi:hypothetical protein
MVAIIVIAGLAAFAAVLGAALWLDKVQSDK